MHAVSHLPHRIIGALLAALLVACGTPAPPNAVPAPSTAPAPTAVPTAPARPAFDEQTRQGYMTLVLLQGSVVTAEDLATRVQSGELDGFGALGQMIAVGVLLKAVDEALAEDAPAAALETAWEEARTIAPDVGALMARWSDQELSAAEIPAELAPITERVEQMLATAERDLSAVYAVDAAELRQLREEAMAGLREQLRATPEPAEPEPTPEPATLPPGATRQDPLPLATEVRLSTWAVTVTEVLRGDEAVQAIAAANSFNEPPGEGMTYVLLTLQVQNIGVEQEAQSPRFGVRVRLTGAANRLYDSASVVVPQPLEGELFPGGATVGQIAFEVPENETNLLALITESFSFDDTQRYVAIDSGARIVPDQAAMAVRATDIGRRREMPARPGETVTTGAWEVTLLEAVRGAEAADRIAQANSFNEPPEPGREYVLARLRVRAVGDESPDTPRSVDGAAVRITGERSVVYDRPPVVEPEPALDGEVYVGGTVEGWVALSVAEGEQGLMLIFEPLFSFDDDAVRFLALE
ncbi:MAG: hypothetical protein DIU80_017860 [Chloroflexota bacterium]